MNRLKLIPIVECIPTRKRVKSLLSLQRVILNKGVEIIMQALVLTDADQVLPIDVDWDDSSDCYRDDEDNKYHTDSLTLYDNLRIHQIRHILVDRTGTKLICIGEEDFNGGVWLILFNSKRMLWRCTRSTVADKFKRVGIYKGLTPIDPSWDGVIHFDSDNKEEEYEPEFLSMQVFDTKVYDGEEVMRIIKSMLRG